MSNTNRFRHGLGNKTQIKFLIAHHTRNRDQFIRTDCQTAIPLECRSDTAFGLSMGLGLLECCSVELLITKEIHVRDYHFQIGSFACCHFYRIRQFTARKMLTSKYRETILQITVDARVFVVFLLSNHSESFFSLSSSPS